MNPLIQLKQTTPLFLIALLLACFGLMPLAQAVVPPPDGGYPGGNTAEGQNALLSLSTGTFNTAVGLFSLLSDSNGSFNTGVGAGTLLANTSDENTATGAGALFSNAIGGFNTANGAFALFSNTEGNDNTATGAFALESNTTGERNTANGAVALLRNTIGSDNTASGFAALNQNTTGAGNTATGTDALTTNTEGSSNTATGVGALIGNTQGSDNTANGVDSLFGNADGEGNTAVNTAVGASAGSGVTTADNVICIGAAGSDQSNSCYIGNIFAQEVALDAAPVLVDSLGKLGVQISSRRFKNEIKPMDNASEAILALKPVTFHYKSDKTGRPQFGLIAEEVAEVNPDLVVRDQKGELLTVRYDQVNAMLLNEFLKEHQRFEKHVRKIQKQEATIAQLKNQIEILVAHSKEQDAQIQRVSDQVQITTPAMRVATENP